LHGVVLQSQLVQAPAGATAGSGVAFAGPCGQPRMARVPEGIRPLDAFAVQVPVPQPVQVLAHEAATRGDEIMFFAKDGRPRKAVVPEGVAGGQTFMALVEPMPVAPVEPLASEELDPWLKAAREFKMNSDFEVPSAEVLHKLDFPGLMAAMKTESAGKLTIQALSDKIVLSRMLDNIGMAQMPLLLAIQDSSLITQEVATFVEGCVEGEAQDLIVKPTHLSNAEGVTSLPGISEEEKPNTLKFLESHLQTFMNVKAKEFESEALQSLRPGFIVQPKYKSCIGFPSPLEIRIVTLWGKARMGVWWWGAPYTGTASQRNAWVVRRPAQSGELSEQDQWDVVHEHEGLNVGFEKALGLFVKHMPLMASAAEQLAVAVGAPFLRVDFFVGDPKWGVRLNEVAYGSGTLHRRPSNKGGMLLVDDSHAMAQILREGMSACQTKLSAEEFLEPLGVKGSTYADMTVDVVAAEHMLNLTDEALQPGSDLGLDYEDVHADLCHTPRCHWIPPGFAPSVHAPPREGDAASGSQCVELPVALPGKDLNSLLQKVEKVRKSEVKKKTQELRPWMSMLDRFGIRFGMQEVDQKRSPQGQARQVESHIRQQSWRGA